MNYVVLNKSKGVKKWRGTIKKILLLILVCVLFSSCGNVKDEDQSRRRGNRDEKTEKEVKEEHKNQENDDDIEYVEDKIEKEKNEVSKEDRIDYSNKYEYIDLGNETIFETALNNGEDVTEKIVIFTVDEIHPKSSLGFNLLSGEHLNFLTEKMIQYQRVTY